MQDSQSQAPVDKAPRLNADTQADTSALLFVRFVFGVGVGRRGGTASRGTVRGAAGTTKPSLQAGCGCRRLTRLRRNSVFGEEERLFVWERLD